MEIPGVAGLLRWIRISLPLALLLLIGGLAGSAAGPRSAGYVLLAAAGVSCSTGFVLLLVLRMRIRSYTRELQARQQPELEGTFRNHSR
jgi:hypothetical protein